MATYHAVFWDGRGLNEPEFSPWLPTTMQWQHWANAGVSFAKRAAVGLSRSEGIVPPSLLARRGDIWPAFMQAFETATPHTLLPSDVHLGNWYVTGDGRMGQHDWQALSRGPWAFDLSYALSAALAVEDRRAWERELIELYLSTLASAGGTAPTTDEAWLQYRRGMLRALQFWLYTIGQGPLQPDMQPRDVCEEHVRRMSQAVVDLESLDSVRAM